MTHETENKPSKEKTSLEDFGLRPVKAVINPVADQEEEGIMEIKPRHADNGNGR